MAIAIYEYTLGYSTRETKARTGVVPWMIPNPVQEGANNRPYPCRSCLSMLVGQYTTKLNCPEIKTKLQEAESVRGSREPPGQQGIQ